MPYFILACEEYERKYDSLYAQALPTFTPISGAGEVGHLVERGLARLRSASSARPAQPIAQPRGTVPARTGCSRAGTDWGGVSRKESFGVRASVQYQAQNGMPKIRARVPREK